jgi:hypothetical protein
MSSRKTQRDRERESETKREREFMLLYSTLFGHITYNNAHMCVMDDRGYQIIRLTVATGFAEVWNNGVLFCSECLTTESHFDGEYK